MATITSEYSNAAQAVWKGVRAWTRRVLEKAGEKIMDVDLEDDDDYEGVPTATSEEVGDSSSQEF